MGAVGRVGKGKSENGKGGVGEWVQERGPRDSHTKVVREVEMCRV